jgi:hypothetical protein
MWEPVVHIALADDDVAMCDAPMEAWSPRAEDPERATCAECVETYVEGWDAAREARGSREGWAGHDALEGDPSEVSTGTPFLVLAVVVTLAVAAAAGAILVAGGVVG